ncbi:AAA domain-containing protein [candidate division KSB3 bacterium]|uniref:AAA domain-containing protein n=1 Tax=candidate division KSB3 bacterium TaxID=2044937 RepID=A0A9D5JXJ3_9BACT|nr:AAA domain-containing protein [candidate division KSB3 bacterium]MBD3325998.1 AAA domain-containing protein [candidate division KSB3 bacterium]
MYQDIRVINEMVQAESRFVENLKTEIAKVIVGQEYMIDRLVIGLLSNGHVLLEGVPGLAKTLTIKTLSDCIQTQFQRIQFTPDLLPADLIGTLIYNQKEGTFVPKKGPIFTNLVLADEINRAPAKVQSALLEAMQERQVTIGDTTYQLDEPFLVLATQNPIEQEGTYPLPEAQVDRFMLKIKITYPTRQEELHITDRMATGTPVAVQPVIAPEDIIKARSVVDQVYLDDKIKEYIVDIVFATREPHNHGLPDLEEMIEYGASPRASIYLHKAARAHAFLRRRGYVTPEDVKAVGMDILRHRVILSYEAEAEERTPEDIVQQIFDTLEVP